MPLEACLKTRIELKVLTTLRHNRMLGIIWIETQEYKFIQNTTVDKRACPRNVLNKFIFLCLYLMMPTKTIVTQSF